MIDKATFESRLAEICIKRGSTGLPRRRIERHILLKSICLYLGPGKVFSEKDINLGIENWLDCVGRNVETDCVTLRRYLVDERFVERDDQGKSYRPLVQARRDLFEAAVETANPEEVVEKFVNDRERERRKFIKNSSRD